jgi:hypothetical protein
MISPEQVEGIANHVEQQGLDEGILNGLRRSYPDIHFTYCMDDDIVTGKPVAERENFHVYLVDGREHCLCLTNDHDIATGMVLAEIIDEDD